MASEKLKAVYIVGPDHEESYKELAHFYNRPGYLIIGDGVNPVNLTDLNVLFGKLDQNTRIDLNVHGGIEFNQHYSLLNNLPTATKIILLRLKSMALDAPITINFWSCHGGKANDNLILLDDLLLFNYIPQEHPLLVRPAVHAIKSNLLYLSKQTNMHLSPVEQFIENLPYNMLQTASLATYTNGQHYELNIKPTLYDVINKPEKVLEDVIKDIIDFSTNLPSLADAKYYDRESFSLAKDQTCRVFSPEEIKEFWAGYLIYRINVGDLEEIEQAIEKSSPEVVKELINQEINKVSSLYIATLNGRADLVEILIKHGAAVDKYNNNGFTVFHNAVYQNSKDIVEIFAYNNAGLNTVDSVLGRTPLHCAVQIGYKEGVEVLVKAKANLDITDNNGDTALHIAVDQNLKDIVEILAREGADLNKVDNFGRTPLHCAVENGYKEIVEVLVKAQEEFAAKYTLSSNQGDLVENDICPADDNHNFSQVLVAYDDEFTMLG